MIWRNLDFMAVSGFLDWHHETGDTRKHPERASPNGFWPTGCPFRRSNHIHCATPSKYYPVSTAIQAHGGRIMARPKKKAENDVIKASAAIQISGKITLLQRRAWNVLLANAYDELPTKDRHTIHVVDLIRILEFNSDRDEYLKEALRALTSCAVEWDILDKDGEPDWGVAALLAGARITRGI